MGSFEEILHKRLQDEKFAEAWKESKSEFEQPQNNCNNQINKEQVNENEFKK